MGTTTGATVRGSNSQNNATSNINTRRGHFSHFETVRANPLGGFGTFGNNNNNPLLGNNNNNNPLPLLLLLSSGFGGGFNPLLRGNAGGLDSNVAALVNALTGA